ncbi:hypothetical protein AJ80_02158 [Polytolypa hystricis UAMH7299]|uniref:Pre-rRNA-processing protein ESF2 n=1 Tax=Polytolypa hystricis (strain UAMH7299) TaxID=1447883 RepID=A0A2B7YRC7_POLH7|nr:hypothetical protein AJ80_02158 [Polytolypa hystricis UAMH7299]
MTVRKRNEFLDIESSDDEGSERGYDSEAAEERKGKNKSSASGGAAGERASKRRRVVSEKEQDDDDSGNEEQQLDEQGNGDDVEEVEQIMSSDEVDLDAEEDNADADEETGRRSAQPSAPPESEDEEEPQSPTKPLNPTKKKNKTGVIYLSSLPPYLKPSALKSLLLQRGFGPISKIFLTPYVPPNSSSAAGKSKSNRRRTYTDGWVEFSSKRTAKICAETLNANIVGGKKGGWYHDDVWNMKYLRGFKWVDLMEQVQRERGEREAKRRIEDARAKKEEKAFLGGVESGKVFEGMRKKRSEKVDKGGDGKVEEMQVRRVFRQNEIMGGEGGGKKGGKTALDADAKRVLGKIF